MLETQKTPVSSEWLFTRFSSRSCPASVAIFAPDMEAAFGSLKCCVNSQLLSFSGNLNGGSSVVCTTRNDPGGVFEGTGGIKQDLHAAVQVIVRTRRAGMLLYLQTGKFSPNFTKPQACLHQCSTSELKRSFFSWVWGWIVVLCRLIRTRLC